MDEIKERVKQTMKLKGAFKMKEYKQQLLKLADTVYTLESQLDDAYYSVPEYPSTAVIASSVDTCRETL